MTLRIPLSRGLVALVDDNDYEMVRSMGPWSAFPRNRTFYARKTIYLGNGRGTSLYMHRVLTDWPRVDHINGDGLDNRRSNLRSTSHAGNMRNARLRPDSTSGYNGVSWHPKHRKWVAAIHVDHRRIYLGSYIDPVEAARAYDEAATHHFGEFARINFPEETYA